MGKSRKSGYVLIKGDQGTCLLKGTSVQRGPGYVLIKGDQGTCLLKGTRVRAY